jgi:tRNA nucleotidyltransferase (CCA-adding enzyme)
VAALFHDLGKARTAPELLPRHLGHEDAGIEPIMAICERLQLPRTLRSAACLASTEHLNVHRFAELRHTRKVDIIIAADRGILKAEGLADIGEADGLGRIPPSQGDGPALLRRLAKVVREAEIGSIPKSLIGEQIGLHIRARRAAAIAKALT